MCCLMLLEPFISKTKRSLVRHSLIYVTAVFIIYLHFDYPQVIAPWMNVARLPYFFIVAICVAIAIRFSPGRRKLEFETTAMDYLVVLIVLSTLVYSAVQTDGIEISVFVVKVVVVLYACELMFVEKRARWNVLTVSSLLAAGIIGFRGIFQL